MFHKKIDGSRLSICTIYVSKCQHSTSIQTKSHPRVKFSNQRATQLIKSFYSKQTKGISAQFDNTQLVQNAFNIYKDIDEPRNGFVINTFLKLCLHCKQHEKAVDIWDDVKILLKREDDSVSYPLLLSAFGRCSLDYAQVIYDHIPDNHKRVDKISHGLMMKYYINYNHPHQAIVFYDNMSENVKDAVTHILAIKACIKADNFKKGQQIQFDLRNNDNVQIKTTLIEFYNHFEEKSRALDLYNSIKEDQRDIASISSMMKCYIDNAEYDKALELYDDVISDSKPNLEPDEICNTLAIKACINTGDYDKGKAIHQKIKDTVNNNNLYLKNILINLYGDCGDLATAKEIFDSIPARQREIPMINAMMKGYLNNDYSGEAVKLYDKINKIHPSKANIKTNHISHLLAIKACTIAGPGNYEKGKKIHARIKDRNEDDSVQIKTALINFYGNNEDIKNAVDVFKTINDNELNIICINAMMDAYIQNEKYPEALALYDHCDKSQPKLTRDNTTYMLGIKACSNESEFEKGKEIHRILTDDTYNSDRLSIPMKTTLMGLYGKMGDIEYAKSLYDSIPDRSKDVYCVDTMMEAYFHNNMNNECTDLFKSMETINPNIKPDVIAYVTVLKAASLYYGREIHQHMMENIDPKIWRHKNIQIHLINMYGKFGMLEYCDEILQDIEENEEYKYLSEIGIWNAMIHAYGRNGDLNKALEFYQFVKEQRGLTANRKTFILLINACNHYGDIDKAQKIWIEDIKDEEIKYDEYIMSALVDGMCRKGMLEEGKHLIESYHPNCRIMWMSLLSGCRKYENDMMAEQVYNEITKRFPSYKDFLTSASVLMSNTMGVGREKGTFKEIDIDGKLYRYCDGDEYDWNIVQTAGYFEPMVSDKKT